ncbi:MAG TPA: bifunctional adenosylcobinamide kinase/adenosylcobinamide-phosphate guanylyltransferase [Aliidongia sp.]|uniref:bifunctional adenosylcobinamide kinase/adenosylcobinamide-phosphate guanylyltransferase n=1 Tax=Aliidongia sp. TaxID=1914230 RepID=UPI002DDCB5A7|nr:bifunctional adenosylcobinamide kinase/adenosylcobinamide-phosphate guanylyltransferase [Aliidongia sp.]HEV2674480.1 bifunctional adenosylcobinamide kinase/adenosylcobinamide-phosphate guanylyltransferase [Aliidongia sp.]
MTSLHRTTLVLGGARSGKSAYAEGLIRAAGGPAIYLATAEAGDGEMAARIAHHRASRGAGWQTIEEPLDLAGTLRRVAAPDRPVLVDCLTLWLSNLMHAGCDIAAETATLAACLPEIAGPVVLVSNEVGQGIVPDNALARAFRDHAGRLHQAVATVADQVVFVVAGLPMVLKSPGKPLVK